MNRHNCDSCLEPAPRLDRQGVCEQCNLEASAVARWIAAGRPIHHPNGQTHYDDRLATAVDLANRAIRDLNR